MSSAVQTPPGGPTTISPMANSDEASLVNSIQQFLETRSSEVETEAELEPGHETEQEAKLETQTKNDNCARCGRPSTNARITIWLHGVKKTLDLDLQFCGSCEALISAQRAAISSFDLTS